MFKPLVIVLALTGGAQAAECPAGSSPDPIEVNNWDVSLVDSFGMKSAKVTIDLRNATSKPFRLVDASIYFKDALGAHIANIAMERDTRAGAGAAFPQTGTYPGSSLNRVPNMTREDVIVYACTRALIYEDGSRDEFKAAVKEGRPASTGQAAARSPKETAALQAAFLIITARKCTEHRNEPAMVDEAVSKARTKLAGSGHSPAEVDELIEKALASDNGKAPEGTGVLACGLFDRAIAAK